MRGWGRYEVIEEIGRGAMGVVYRARDPKIERIVALKTLAVPAGATPDEAEELRRRFEREAKAAGRLAHPNIVHIYDSGEDYIAMELVEGATLDRLMAQGALPPSTGLHILDQVALALDHAHEARVIHRDMKPSNILVGRGGVVKIMDFGIAKVLGGESLLTGRLMGTPRYMSPEQVTGAHVDGASDNFALAEIAYEVLAGEKAFPGETVTGILYRIVHEDPAPPSRVNRDLPRSVDPIFARAMAKTPSNRYARATDFIADLRSALASTRQVAKVTTELPPRAKPLWRVLLIPPAVVLAAVITLIVGVPDARRTFFGGPRGPKVVTPAPVPTRTQTPVTVTPRPQKTPVLEPVSEPEQDVTPTTAMAPEPAPPTTPEAETPPPPPAKVTAKLAIPTPPDRGGEESQRPRGPIPTMSPAPPSEPPTVLPPSLPPGPEILGLRFFPSPAPVVGGAQIRSVIPGSPTWNAGLRPKDIITKWQGTLIATAADLIAAGRYVPAGGVVVEYLRDEGNSLQAGQTTVSVSTPAIAKRVSLSDTNVADDVDGKMRVTFRVEASGYGGRTLKVKARLLEITGEHVVRVCTTKGVAVEASAELYPESDTWLSESIPVFLPYGQPAGAGERILRVSLVAQDESGQEVATFASMPFSVTESPGPPPSP